MLSSRIEKLLVLQDRDIRRNDFARLLEEIPLQREKLGEDRRVEEARLEEARARLRSLELAHRTLEGEIAEEENQAARYRTQQLSVKKNDEYQALETEITRSEEKVGDLEEKAIGALIDIDEQRVKVAAAEAAARTALEEIERHLTRLAGNETSIRDDLEKAGRESEAAASEVPAPDLRSFRYVQERVKRPPWIVPAEDKQCRGCFLKVSGEVDTALHTTQELVRCNNCGRILYLPD